jgi:hypothetical protein
MKSESFIRLLAGSFVLLSAVLVYWVSPWWLLLTAFVGLNLIQSAFTGFCPPTWLLAKLGRVRADGTLCFTRPSTGPGKAPLSSR